MPEPKPRRILPCRSPRHKKLVVTNSVLDALNEMSPEDRVEAAEFMRGFADAIARGEDPSGTLTINGEAVESEPVSDEEWAEIKASMTPEQRAEVERYEKLEDDGTVL